LLVDGFDINGLPARLSCQRFYDHCRDALQPRGVMVTNLPSGHRYHAIHVERVRRSFGDTVIRSPSPRTSTPSRGAS
jgi:spermidine synthase